MAQVSSPCSITAVLVQEGDGLLPVLKGSTAEIQGSQRLQVTAYIKLRKHVCIEETTGWGSAGKGFFPCTRWILTLRKGPRKCSEISLFHLQMRLYLGQALLQELWLDTARAASTAQTLQCSVLQVWGCGQSCGHGATGKARSAVKPLKLQSGSNVACLELRSPLSF